MKNDYQNNLRQVSRKLIRELGMLQLHSPDTQATPGHWHALLEIAQTPQITLTELSRILLLSHSSVSRLIKSLIQEGLIVSASGLDKREKYLSLTLKGETAVCEIDTFSNEKVQGAFEFLTEKDIDHIIEAIRLYSEALEKSRLIRSQVKISTLSTSRPLRKQIIQMITQIQKDEFSIPVTDEINACILKAEETFYFRQSCNFWYATNDAGQIIGSVGLKEVDGTYAEVKKFFVAKEYRGKGVAQKLMYTLIKTAAKHKIPRLVLGTVDKLQAAQRFYEKVGFVRIDEKQLPKAFDKCPLDSVFFEGETKALLQSVEV